MPLIEVAGARHNYRIEGREDSPVLVFSHSLGCDQTQWDPQAAQLQSRFRVLRYDIRGHGASDATPGDYTIELLARDALGIADALGMGRFAFCGLSLGGMIGQWLAAFTPDRVTALVLANTSSHYPDPSLIERRRTAVLEGGMTAVVDGVMERFFTPESLAANSPAIANIRRTVLATNPAGYAACCAAIRDMNQTSILAAIRAPALIVAGDRDVSTPWQGHGDVLAGELRQASVAHLPTAHLSNVERPRSFTAALLRFLAPPPADALSGGLEEVVLKRFEDPDEVRVFEKGKFELVRLGGMTIGRATYEPGWKWSIHVGAATGAATCSVEHIGLVISGQATAAMQDGRVIKMKAGDVFYIAPGHDSWVIGDEPYVSLHFLGADQYAGGKGAEPPVL